MWENVVQPDRPQMSTWRMLRIACWIIKAADTHSEYVILTAFQLQQYLHEHTLLLRYTYTACLLYSVVTIAGQPIQKYTVYDVFLSALRPYCNQHEVVIMLN